MILGNGTNRHIVGQAQEDIRRGDLVCISNDCKVYKARNDAPKIEKICNNCKHKNTIVLAHPCSGCWGYDRWDGEENK